ncbi:unnamed protein product, partial [Sphacelaria rigidula]
MSKHFGVTPTQALRTQALLKLGVTEEDVRVAERLMSPSKESKDLKTETLWGYTAQQMSYRKALEVLGISHVIAEEARAKFLGKLGARAWGNPPIAEGEVHKNNGACGGPFRLEEHTTASRDGGCVLTRFDAADVSKLEDVCLSQHLRIQQLELQV